MVPHRCEPVVHMLNTTYRVVASRKVYDEATCFYIVDMQNSNLTKKYINRSNNPVKG